MMEEEQPEDTSAQETELGDLDLYGSISEGTDSLSLQLLRDEMAALKSENASLKKTVNTQEVKIKGLLRKSAILLRNISCLFSTAKVELNRKDRQISALRQRIEGSPKYDEFLKKKRRGHDHHPSPSSQEKQPIHKRTKLSPKTQD